MPWWFYALVVAVPIGFVLSVWLEYKGDENKHATELATRLNLWANNGTPRTFTLVLGDDAYADLATACDEALGFWNKAVPGLWAAAAETTQGKQGPIIAVMPVEKSPHIPPSTVGHARITTSREGVIISAGIYINMDLAKHLSPLQLRRTVAHEMGHVMGLEHDEVSGSVMNKTALKGKFKVSPLDQTILEAAYR